MNYYVDYENVVCSGLVGIDKLTSNDTVNIYYSNDPNVDMETVIRIRNSKANIVFLKLCNSIKQMNRSNALDIVLSNDIVQSIISLRTKDICIISKDKDYDMLISELKSKHSGLNITRAASIASSSQKAAASKRLLFWCVVWAQILPSPMAASSRSTPDTPPSMRVTAA